MTELYKRLRPKKLSGVIGNADTVKALANMLRNKRLPHVLLFYGPSGCGKTTLARIICREMQCDPADVREINSSSYRGIDSIREIARSSNLAPIGPCRVYVMDEVHKLSNDAQNAALKLLEDTPSHAYFVLCTTDPAKLIPPLRNRCCELPVSALTESEMKALIEKAASREFLALESEVIEEMIERANGSARKALVLLEKISNLPKDQHIRAIKGSDDDLPEVIDLCRALLKKASWMKVSKILRSIEAEPESVRRAVLGYMSAVLLKGSSEPNAYFVIQAFSDPLYDIGKPGLVAACFEAIHGD